MKMSRSFLSPLVAFLFVSAFLSQSGIAVAAGRSGRGGDTVSKVVEINRQALAQIQANKYEAARDALWGAIALLTDANLGEHPISARTHIHLAAVYMTGFNDRTKAIRQFVIALKIDPNIKITPQVETAALDEAFDAARGQVGLAAQARTAPAAPSGKTPAASTPAPTAEEQAMPASGSSAGTSAGGRRGLRGARKFVDQEEPTPPARVPEPFYCPLPDEVPPKEDIPVRCVTQKQPRKASATVFYREKGAEDFTPLPMTRSPKGWLSATVPGAAVTGSAFQYYLEAKVPGIKEPLSIGSADGPNLMPIVDGAAPVNNTMLAMLLEGKDTSTRPAPMVEDNAPLDEINKQYQMDEELRKYHRRLPGAVFISLGGGAFAQTYHGAMSLDSHDPTIQLQAGPSGATLLQTTGEIGYQFTDKLGMSIQARLQITPSHSSGWVIPPGSSMKQPPTSALAIFLRGQYALLTLGNFQAFGSAIAGFSPMGKTFLGYVAGNCELALDGTLVDGKPYKCPDPPNHLVGHSDTVSGGPVAVGLGVGMMYHITRSLAIWVEGRGLYSFGSIVLGEWNAGLAIAHKFESSAPASRMPEGQGGWERPPGEEDKDAPPSD
jgi:hypothetical protein